MHQAISVNHFNQPPLNRHSRYMDPSNGQLTYRMRPNEAPDARDRRAHAALLAHVLDADHPCVMARSVFTRDSFRLSTYGTLAAPANAAMLWHDLVAFSAEFPQPVPRPVSFVACFEGPHPADELAFETALWKQLQSLHDIDKKHFDWCRDVESDPNDSSFSFSVGGRAFFLIGMHPLASRLARRTPMPAIVFNLHEQFVELRSQGKFDRVRDTVQARDKQLQGTVNPMAANFGERSEAAQYSGREVGAQWMCPFATA